MEIAQPIQLDEFRTLELTGTTNGSADTKQWFRTNRASLPSFWLPLEGNVYVPRYGLKEDEIDIRSTAVSEKFRVLLFFD